MAHQWNAPDDPPVKSIRLSSKRQSVKTQTVSPQGFIHALSSSLSAQNASKPFIPFAKINFKSLQAIYPEKRTMDSESNLHTKDLKTTDASQLRPPGPGGIGPKGRFQISAAKLNGRKLFTGTSLRNSLKPRYLPPNTGNGVVAGVPAKD
jgi:hypothetical protein